MAYPQQQHYPGVTAPPMAPSYPPGPGMGTSQFPPPNSGSWTTGLYGCSEDCESCCCACWCPCVPVGRYANILDQGHTATFTAGAIFCLVQWFTGCGCLYSCLYRTKLRQKFGLPEDPCNDLCTEFCCNCCSIAQVYRELKNRNIDPKLGYEYVRATYEQPAVATGVPVVQEMRKM